MADDVIGAEPSRLTVPFAGVVSPLVAEGDRVESGQVLASIEAMKMEAAITAPRAGVVTRLLIAEPRRCEGGDLILLLAPSPTP